jgi:hypothetical protein
MTRTQLEHLIRACGEVSGERELVIIGSQSILGAIPNPPASMTMSMEADIYIEHEPQKSDEIDGVLGEISPFHETHGYYAQGVGPKTATLPAGWRDRVHLIENSNTNGVRALCLDPHDLAMAKYVAGRGKDLEFNREMAVHGFIDRLRLLALIEEMPIEASLRERVRARIESSFVP